LNSLSFSPSALAKANQLVAITTAGENSRSLPERGNADPLGNGSASADIYNLMPARLSPSRHLRIGRSKAGLGLFAQVAIKKGQFIVRYSGRKITTEVADQLDTRYLFEVNSRWTVDGASRRNRARLHKFQANNGRRRAPVARC
jgi:SET domain-containing protein